MITWLKLNIFNPHIFTPKAVEYHLYIKLLQSLCKIKLSNFEISKVYIIKMQIYMHLRGIELVFIKSINLKKNEITYLSIYLQNLFFLSNSYNFFIVSVISS